MPLRRVAAGECLTDIAEESGLAWDTIWNHPENAALRQQRPNANVLMAGDSVFVPDKRAKEESCVTTERHHFRLRGVPVKLVFRLLTLDAEPRAGVTCRVDVDGTQEDVVSDDEGHVEVNVPPRAATAKVSVLDEAGEEDAYYEFDLAHLNPVSDDAGVIARLRNLGFYDGPSTGALDDAVHDALRRFQASAGLAENGEADSATRAALESRHGS